MFFGLLYICTSHVPILKNPRMLKNGYAAKEALKQSCMTPGYRFEIEVSCITIKSILSKWNEYLLLKVGLSPDFSLRKHNLCGYWKCVKASSDVEKQPLLSCHPNITIYNQYSLQIWHTTGNVRWKKVRCVKIDEASHSFIQFLLPYTTKAETKPSWQHLTLPT